MRDLIELAVEAIYLPMEWGELVDTIISSLFRSGAFSLPTDACECIYWGEYVWVVLS